MGLSGTSVPNNPLLRIATVEVSAETSQRAHHVKWVPSLTFVITLSALSAGFPPTGLGHPAGAAFGLLLAVVTLVGAFWIQVQPKSLIFGTSIGACGGILIATLVAVTLSRSTFPEQTKTFLNFTVLLAMTYLGASIGSMCAENWKQATAQNRESKTPHKCHSVKLLDTSVLIDGRIADICEAQFLDGPLLVPQFVLRELQMVADSSDSLKRQRGRRGLEVLQRMQKFDGLDLQIVEEEVSQVLEVDHKLVELARRKGAKIVTNDFNLNKYASVQGLSVLNINLLANALKPAVLPGECMRVLILREGKESNQGVAYLNDGTMVVVDGGRRAINKSVVVIVTSVHQTPAGKMIFGRLDERGEQPVVALRQASAALASIRNGKSTEQPEFETPSVTPGS